MNQFEIIAQNMLQCETLADLQRYYSAEAHPLVARGEDDEVLSHMIHFVVSECERNLTEYLYGLEQRSVLEGPLAVQMYLYLRLKPERRIHDQDIIDDAEELLYHLPKREASVSAPSTLNNQLLLDMAKKMQELFPFLRGDIFIFYKTGSVVDCSRRYGISEARFPLDDLSRTMHVCMVNTVDSASPREQLWHVARVLGKQFFDKMQVGTMMDILQFYEETTPEEVLNAMSQEFADTVLHAMDLPGCTGTEHDDDDCQEFVSRVNAVWR